MGSVKKIFAFELTMPGRGSWNRHWSGENSKHIVIRQIPKEQCDKLNAGPWFYRWNDGWEAEVTAKQVTSREAKMLKKLCKGFGGYDWMVDSIVQHGKIVKM